MTSFGILEVEIHTELIVNFIKERLNRDNFWNVMFWVWMSSGLSAAWYFGESDTILGGVFFWITLILVPLVVKGCSEVVFIGNKVFLNSEGQSLVGKYPKHLGAIIILTIAVMIITGLVMDKCFDHVNNDISSTILTSILFLIPTLYFIYKNCPISILFNKHAWHANSGTGFYQKGHTPSIPPSRDYITDPKYKNMICNIYNDHHRSRK